MSPTQFHAKEEPRADGGTYDDPPLKTNKDSTFNHRLPPSSSASSTNATHQPPRRPVIIYTHSPKVIHTHPRDFMALVQKLTGYTPPPEETRPSPDQNNRRSPDDNESTSVVTEEHGSPHVNSCFVDAGVAVAPPLYRSTVYDPYYNSIPVFPSNPSELLCTPGHQIPFYNPDHSMLLNRNLSSSCSSLHVLKEYPDI